jgi:predicted SprT family Zn-dependent metalloprotease
MLMILEEYTKDDMQFVFEFAWDQLKQHPEIPIPFDHIRKTLGNDIRMSNRKVLGRCSRKYDYTGSDGDVYDYTISLNPNLSKIEDRDDKIVLSVLAHEFCHTINGCFNHGREFHKWGKIIGDVLGVVIDTHADDGESKLFRSLLAKKPYVLYCPKCDKNVASFAKFCKKIADPSLYKCGICGGDIDSYKLSSDGETYEPYIMHDDEAAIAQATGNYFKCNDCGYVEKFDPIHSRRSSRLFDDLLQGYAYCPECGSEDTEIKYDKKYARNLDYVDNEEYA